MFSQTVSSLWTVLSSALLTGAEVLVFRKEIPSSSYPHSSLQEWQRTDHLTFPIVAIPGADPIIFRE